MTFNCPKNCKVVRSKKIWLKLQLSTHTPHLSQPTADTTMLECCCSIATHWAYNTAHVPGQQTRL